VVLALLVPCTGITAEEPVDSVHAAVALLNAGDLPGAERILRLRVSEAATTGHRLDEAVARKWLGIAEGRSGVTRLNTATNELYQAVALLEPLVGQGDKEAREELGYGYFDLAEVFRTCAEIDLREHRLNGAAPTAYFTLIHDCVSPAENAIDKASAYYPPDRLSDIDYARGELALLLIRLQRMFLPGTDSADGYERSAGFFKEVMRVELSKGKSARNDVILSSGIRMAEIKMEQCGDGKTDSTKRKAAALAALKDLEVFEHLSVDETEIGGHLLYTKAVLMLDAGEDNLSPENVKTIEAALLKAADCVELMRGKIAVNPVFEDVGSFFSQRTHVYEALGRLYAATHQAEKMLAAVEKMKARAFRDILATPSGPDFDLAALQQHLRQDNAGLVEFFYGPERAWAIWVPPASPVEIIDLPIDGQSLVLEMSKVGREFADSKDRRRWMRMLSGTMRESEVKTMRDGFRAANRLYALLLRPLEARAHDAKVTRLYVVPHHVMNYLSFDSLVTEVDEQNLLGSKFYVEHGMPLTYLPSAAVLSDIGSSAEVTGGLNCVFSRSNFHSIKPTFPIDLEGTVPESKTVGKTTSASVFCEADASESRLRNLAGPLNLLYFATHGVLDARRPLNSAILLAATDPDTPSLDGRVTVGELLTDLRGRLHANLVVLSACHTNEGETTPTSGDDLTALSRGFMVAGARSVLATQWEASDSTFPAIMGFFLEAWMKQGQSKDEALTSALRQFLSKNDFPVWRHPHFWGSVILMGKAK